MSISTGSTQVGPINQLCVIEGDFKLSNKYGNVNRGSVKQASSSLSSTSTCCSPLVKRVNLESSVSILYPSIEKLNDLLDSYKQKIKSNSSTTLDEFVVMYSKDGSEICSSLMQSLSSDFDTTLVNSTVIETKSMTQIQRIPINNSGSNFVCFIISDFDQNDPIYLKLEETQAKLSPIFSSLNSSVASSTVNNNSTLTSMNISCNNLNKRFLIFGWPVLQHCIENNLVLLYLNHVLNTSKLTWFHILEPYECYGRGTSFVL